MSEYLLIETRVASLVWSPNSHQLAGAYFDVNVLHKIDTPRIQIMTVGSENDSLIIPWYANALTWKPDGSEIASGDNNGAVHRWNAATGEQLATYQHADSYTFQDEDKVEISFPVVAIAWHPTTNLLASAGLHNSVRIWDTSSGRLLNSIELGFTEETVLDVAINWVGWNSDGTKIATTHWDGAARIWDANTLELLSELHGHTDFLLSAAWHPNASSNKLATSSADGTIRVCDTSSEQSLLTLQGHTDWVAQLDWSPDGSRLVSVSPDHTIRIWNATTGEQLQVIETESEVWAVDWSSDGQVVYGNKVIYSNDKNQTTRGTQLGIIPSEQLPPPSDSWH
jgi:WD40 repeat protein